MLSKGDRKAQIKGKTISVITALDVVLEFNYIHSSIHSFCHSFMLCFCKIFIYLRLLLAQPWQIKQLSSCEKSGLPQQLTVSPVRDAALEEVHLYECMVPVKI